LVLNFKLIIGAIGVALITYSSLAMLPLPVPIMLNAFWVFNWGSQDAVIMCIIFLLTLPTGLMLYIIGRKEFSKQTILALGIFQIKPHRLLMFFGLTLTAVSLSFLSFVGTLMHSDFARPRTTEEWTMYQLLSAWGGFGVISGILWLVDGVKIGEAKAPPTKKEVILEPQTKYPKDLLTRYMKQYPYNPTGVLEWHIQKKMKEGKTREQALEELSKES